VLRLNEAKQKQTNLSKHGWLIYKKKKLAIMPVTKQENAK
jgi:hypothetical protein